MSLQEDITKIITADTLLKNDFDIEGDNLHIVGVKDATNGTVVLNDDGSITFTPNANYNSSTNNQFDSNSALYKGDAGFTYIVEDANGSQREAYVKLDVEAINDAPTLIRNIFNRTEEIVGYGSFRVNDIDSNVDALSVQVVSSLSFNQYFRNSRVTSGKTNIDGRTVDANGDFSYVYNGQTWILGPDYIYDMRPFVIQVSDEGDIDTGLNIESTAFMAGVYFHHHYHDPVVIDLDGDGVEIEEIYYETYEQNLRGVGKDDAILVWDVNQDGTISSSIETSWAKLSKSASNDLDAMREIFDTNQDGIFDKNDEEWNNFALWQDKNQDGVVDKDEFISINDSSIKQINLETDIEKTTNDYIDEFASYTTTDGETHEVAAAYLDITLTEDKLTDEEITLYKEAIKLNEELAYESNIENFEIIEEFKDDEQNLYEDEMIA